jgi:NAD(P)H-hydrate epimerase
LARSAEELRGDAAEMFNKLPVTPLWVSEEQQFENAEVNQALKAELIVDAILGTGFKPPIAGLGRRAVEIINQEKRQVLAVDIPSGAYTDSFLAARDQGLMAKADGVITFTSPKAVHVFGNITHGPLAVSAIGSPAELILDESTLDIEVFPPVYLNVVFSKRADDAHKGDFGHILVIGGSVGKSGAAAMAGLSALRSGAGLVTVACPRSVQPSVAAFAPELMTEPLPETEIGTLAQSAIERLQQLAEKKDTIVLGPGLSRHPETDELVRKLVPYLQPQLILDADGLNAFAGHADELRREGLLIITPHPGELSRLIDKPIHEIEANRIKVARETARKHSAIVVLKGHRTLIAAPSGQVWVNITGNPGMAKGGSGDVLSGVIAASLNQMQGGFGRKTSPKQGLRMQQLLQRRSQGDSEAAKELEELGMRGAFEMLSFCTAAAVCLHGLAGDVAGDLCGEHSMIATDVINNIGEALAIAKAQMEQDKFFYLQR